MLTEGHRARNRPCYCIFLGRAHVVELAYVQCAYDATTLYKHQNTGLADLPFREMATNALISLCLIAHSSCINVFNFILLYS
jgi:hypothetical protein